MKRITLLLMGLILALGFMSCCLELELKPESEVVVPDRVIAVPVFDFDTYTSKSISSKSIVIEGETDSDLNFIIFAPMFNGLTEDFVDGDSYTTNVRGNTEKLSVQTSGTATTFKADYEDDGNFSVTIDETSGDLILSEQFVFDYILHTSEHGDLTGSIYRELNANFDSFDLEKYNISTVIKLYTENYMGSHCQMIAAVSVQLYKDDTYFGILIKAVRTKDNPDLIGSSWGTPDAVLGMPEDINLDGMVNGDSWRDNDGDGDCDDFSDEKSDNQYCSYVYEFATNEFHTDEFDLDDSTPYIWESLWKSEIL